MRDDPPLAEGAGEWLSYLHTAAMAPAIVDHSRWALLEFVRGDDPARNRLGHLARTQESDPFISHHSSSRNSVMSQLRGGLVIVSTSLRSV